MMINPQQVIAALRSIETDLHGLIVPIEDALNAARQAIEQQQRRSDDVRMALERKLAEAQADLKRCNNRVQDNDPPDCSRYKALIDKYQTLLVEARNAHGLLEDAARTFEYQATMVPKVVQKVIPAATHWLRERENALEDFEHASGAADIERIRFDAGMERVIAHNPPNIRTISATQVSAYMTLISVIPASVGGGHGYIYHKARQQFLYGLASDPSQPKYVRGWIKQELNRLKQVQRAKADGTTPPGGNKRHIHGIPGYDVGHHYPDIDLPENFRLELVSSNRARPGIARRLGITKWR